MSTVRWGKGWIDVLGLARRPIATSASNVRNESQARLMVTRDIGPYISAMRDRFESWRERRYERRQLMKLDDRMLRDIGISRADAEFEYRKPFWK